MQKGFIQLGMVIAVLVAVALIGGASYVTQKSQSNKTESINQETMVQTSVFENTNDTKTQDESAMKPNNAILCNGTYYTHCSDNLRFVCPKIGEAYCETPQKNSPASVAANTLLCNGKEWLKCPQGYNFYCPAQGDAQCMPQPLTNNVQVDASSNQAYAQQVERLLQQEIDKQNSWYEEYLRKQAEIDALLKPIHEEERRITEQYLAECVQFVTGQKASECDQLTLRLNSLEAEASRISGIYPERKTLPQSPYPSYQQWRFDTMRDGLSGTIWSPNSTTRYRWSCTDPYSCVLYSY